MIDAWTRRAEKYEYLNDKKGIRANISVTIDDNKIFQKEFHKISFVEFCLYCFWEMRYAAEGSKSWTERVTNEE